MQIIELKNYITDYFEKIVQIAEKSYFSWKNV